MTTASRAGFSALVLLLLSGAMASGQSGGQGVTGPDARLIRLNVIATTKDGQPVSDLKADEIEIRENGRPQKLLSFQAALAGGAPSASRGYIVFAVDESTTDRDDRLVALKLIGEWIDKHKAESDQVALVSLGDSVKVWRLFTADKRLLLPKLEEMKAQAGSSNDDLAISQLLNTLRDCRSGLSAASCGAAAVDSYKNEQENLLRNRKAVLWSFVKMLEPFPGEKRVIYCTNGFALNPGSWAADAYQQVFTSLGAPSTAYNSSIASRSSTVESLWEVTSAAMRASVTFYTVYGRARSETRRDSVFQPWLDPSVADSLSVARRRNSTDSLSALGNDTGGRAYLGSADVQDAAQRAVGELAGTFYATYTPEDTEFDGKYRKIEVRALRPNVVARTRAGYLAIASKALGILATASEPQVQGTRYSVPLLIQLDPAELAWSGPPGKRTDQVAVVMSVLNAKRELLSTNVLNLELPEPKTKLAEINVNAGLGPGQYICILQVTESATTNSAATSVAINLPPLGAK